MTTLEIEAQKALWVRDILNLDNSEMITELKENYDRTKLRIQRRMKKQAPSPDSKAYIMKGLKEAFGEIKISNQATAKEGPWKKFCQKSNRKKTNDEHYCRTSFRQGTETPGQKVLLKDVTAP